MPILVDGRNSVSFLCLAIRLIRPVLIEPRSARQEVKRNGHAVETRVVREGVIMPHLYEGSINGVDVVVSKQLRSSADLVLTGFEVIEELCKCW